MFEGNAVEWHVKSWLVYQCGGQDGSFSLEKDQISVRVAHRCHMESGDRSI